MELISQKIRYYIPRVLSALPCDSESEASMDWSQIISPAYWITFAATFLAVAQWESVRPERKWIVPAGRRWARHCTLLAITSVIRMLFFRLTPIGVAALAANRDWGLFHASFFQ